MQLPQHREIELAVGCLEPPAHAALAADDRREGTVGEFWPLQDVVRLVDGLDARRIGTPDEHRGEDLRVQRGHDHGAARDRILGLAQEIQELLRQFGARSGFPGILQEPIGERIAVQVLELRD